MALRWLTVLIFAALVATLPVRADAAAYAPVGVQQNVPVATVLSGGWTECFSETYNNNTTPIASVLSACNGANLMMACRLTGDATLSLLAEAPKADVIFETGTGNTTHSANGVEWYFNDSWSWGYAQGGDAVVRTSCDYGPNTHLDTRMCIHTSSGNLNTGYRCGDNDLNGATSYERIFYTSQAAAIPTLSQWMMLVMVLLLAMTGMFVLRRRVA